MNNTVEKNCNNNNNNNNNNNDNKKAVNDVISLLNILADCCLNSDNYKINHFLSLHLIFIISPTFYQFT